MSVGGDGRQYVANDNGINRLAYCSEMKGFLPWEMFKNESENVKIECRHLCLEMIELEVKDANFRLAI